MNQAVSVDEERQLRLGAEALGVELAAEQREALLCYVDLMFVWNRAAGLTTIARANAVRLHLLDSLAAASSLGEGACVDLGTGAGLPGLVLAISKPAVSFVLVESNRRRCSFLLEAIRVLRVPNVRVIESDVESLDPAVRYPTVISRAFRQPPEFLRIARRVVAPGGFIVLLLADPAEVELRDLEQRIGVSVESCRRLQLPGGQEPRTIVRFRLP